MDTVKVKSLQNSWRFFFFAFGFTWLAWSPGILDSLGLINLPVPFIVFFFIGTWGPFLAATLVNYQDGGWKNVKDFWKRGFDFNFPARWLLIIVIISLLVSAVPLGLYMLFGGEGPKESILFQPWMIVPVFLTYFFTGGGNEEWGWRGFALDRFQERWNPTIASIVLGIIWGCWHIPLFFIEGTGQSHMSLIIFIVATPGLSILHTLVYNKTEKNLLAVWLFHAMLGTAWETFPIVQPQISGYKNMYIYDFLAVTILAILVLVVEGTLLGYKKESVLGESTQIAQ